MSSTDGIACLLEIGRESGWVQILDQLHAIAVELFHAFPDLAVCLVVLLVTEPADREENVLNIESNRDGSIHFIPRGIPVHGSPYCQCVGNSPATPMTEV